MDDMFKPGALLSAVWVAVMTAAILIIAVPLGLM